MTGSGAAAFAQCPVRAGWAFSTTAFAAVADLIEAELGELLAIELRQPRGQLLRLAVVQRGDHVPVFTGTKVSISAFWISRSATMHPAGRARAGSLRHRMGERLKPTR